MVKTSAQKEGFTLIEVLVVVAIMGILSSIGVVSLQHAIQNARIKDAGINVAAFFERTANEANRMSSKLCVVGTNTTLKTYKGACEETGTVADANLIDQMTLESLNEIVQGKTCPDGATEFSSDRITYKPKLGLSAIPTGCVVIRYGRTDRFAAVVKLATKNSVYYKLSYDSGASWF